MRFRRPSTRSRPTCRSASTTNACRPKFLLEKALEQVKELAEQKPEDSPLSPAAQEISGLDSGRRAGADQGEMLDAIGKEVLPAYQRFARFLEVSYIPAGRSEPGISALPDGAKYYQFLIRRTTTTDLTADQIHQIGLDEVKKDEAEMLAIAQKLGFQDLKSFRASLKTNPKAEARLSRRVAGRLSRLSDARCRPSCRSSSAVCPRRRSRLSPVPDYLEKTSAPAYYEPGTPDGSRPGRLLIDTYNATDRNLYSVEDIAYHEGIPGHHLQISIAQELTDIPEFRKYSATRRTPRAGGSTPSVWARMSASTRIPTPTTAAWKATSGAPSVSSSTPASTPNTGPASRWSITSTTTRPSTKPACRPRWIATSHGQARHWPTRSAS